MLDAPLAKVEAAREHGAEIHVGGDSVDECLKAAPRAPTRAGSPSCTRSTTRWSWPGRACSGSSCSRTCPTSPGRRAGRRRRAVLGRRDRGQVGAARRRGRRRAGRRLRALPRVAAPRGAGAGRLRADDRRRHRGQAPRRPHAAAARPLGRRRRGRRRGRERRGDGRADGAREARRRGAGAVGVAALLGGQVRAAESGTTVAVLSGGNVDAGLLASIARRHETEAGRRLVLFTRLPDRSGNLARLLDRVAGEAPTSSTSRTCARASTCTCARPPSSS